MPQGIPNPLGVDIPVPVSQLLHVLDWVGVFLCAVSGALLAAKRHMDWFGAVVLAIVASTGGGTIRDVLLATQPAWVKNPTPILIALAGAAVALTLGRRISTDGKWFAVIDASALGAFTVLGVQKAMVFQVAGLPAVVMGVLTGIAGGMLRDILSGQVPFVLRREIYATAALVGATLFLVLSQYTSDSDLPALVAALTIFGIRCAVIRWRWSFPALGSRPAPPMDAA